MSKRSHVDNDDDDNVQAAPPKRPRLAHDGPAGTATMSNSNTNNSLINNSSFSASASSGSGSSSGLAAKVRLLDS